MEQSRSNSFEYTKEATPTFHGKIEEKKISQKKKKEQKSPNQKMDYA